MAVKKIPQRMCAICRQMREKPKLIRIVKTSENTAAIDETGKLNGRGAYICKEGDGIEKARKTKGLEKSLKMSLSDEIYAQLEKGSGESG